MATEVKRTAETLLVTEVSSIAVTDIVSIDGLKVRSIRIFGSAGEAALPVLEIKVSAADPEAVKITTPEIRF